MIQYVLRNWKCLVGLHYPVSQVMDVPVRHHRIDGVVEYTHRNLSVRWCGQCGEDLGVGRPLRE